MYGFYIYTSTCSVNRLNWTHHFHLASILCETPLKVYRNLKRVLIIETNNEVKYANSNSLLFIFERNALSTWISIAHFVLLVIFAIAFRTKQNYFVPLKQSLVSSSCTGILLFPYVHTCYSGLSQWSWSFMNMYVDKIYYW